MQQLLRFFFLSFAISTFAQAETTIDLVSEPGDYIGQGQSYSYNDDNADITYSANYDNGISVRIRNLPDDPWLTWSLDFAAPGNAQIQPGQYTGAERFPFQDNANPGLSFSGQGRGCNTLSGSFDIYEVEYDGDGVVTALSASFEQHCEGGTPALRGDIVFNTIPPVGVSAIGMAPYRVVCKNRTTGQRIVKTLDERFYDCKKLGLNINPGDNIQIMIRGIAEH